MAQQTPFHRVQEEIGADFIEFGDWFYANRIGDPIVEHHAVRTAVGLWDQTPLPKWHFRGPDALRAADHVFTHHLADLEIGQVRYSPYCNPDGKIVSDATAMRMAEDHLWVLPTLETDFDFIRESTDGFQVEIESFTPELGLLELQGPLSREVLASVCDRDPHELSYFRFWPDEVGVAGIPCTVARTGYSGELGYEIFCRREHGEDLWHALVAAGPVTPYGLAAVETLRIESGLLFVGVDYTPGETSPFDLSLDRFIAVDKGDFQGADALRAEADSPPRRFVTLNLDSDSPPGYAIPVHAEGEQVGVLTSSCKSPTLDRVIGLSIIDSRYSTLGQEIEVAAEGGNVAASVDTLPAYDPEKRRPRV
jgi:aminomethyltransferase